MGYFAFYQKGFVCMDNLFLIAKQYFRLTTHYNKQVAMVGMNMIGDGATTLWFYISY